MTAAALTDLPGLREDELQALGPCRICGKPQLAQDKVPLFYCVTISRAGFDADAVRRRAGLEMMLGSGPMARAMGPDQPLARVIDGPHKVFVHEECAASVHHLLMLMPETD